jgi:lauroyl/myristoyl acyltransferase
LAAPGASLAHPRIIPRISLHVFEHKHAWLCPTLEHQSHAACRNDLELCFPGKKSEN